MTDEQEQQQRELERELHEKQQAELQKELDALAEQQRLIDLEAAKADGATEGTLGTPIDQLIDDLLNT